MAVLVCGRSSTALSQDQFPPFSFSDPAQMFERMFGEDSEADRAALRTIEVSIADEKRLGEQILDAALASWKAEGIEVISRGRDVEYLQSLVEILKPQMTNGDRYPSVRVLFAKSSRIDARSCPGGTLVFFEGLLNFAGSEAALAGIVGHELSHLDRGHQLLPLKRLKLMEQTFTEGSDGPDPAQFLKSGPLMIRLLARPFRPEDEREADRDGVAWSFAAGYDSREMARLFNKLADKTKEPDEPRVIGPSYFRTHQFSRDRGREIRKQFLALQKKHPEQELVIGKENIQQRKSRKQLEDEQ